MTSEPEFKTSQYESRARVNNKLSKSHATEEIMQEIRKQRAAQRLHDIE